MSNIIYPQGGGGVQIAVAAGESIAVYTKDVAQVFKITEYTNQPSTRELLETVTNRQKVLGPYASGATLEISAGAAEVLYNIGTDPVVTEQYAERIQAAPAAVDATATLDPANILRGIVSSTTAAAVTATLPDASVMTAGIEQNDGLSFDWAVVNTGPNAFTIAVGTGHTILGAAAVATGTSGMFRTRKISDSSYVTTRIA